MEVDWLANDLRRFYEFLNGIDNCEVFGNEFLKIVLENQYYSNQLFFRVFLPWLFFMICNLIYISWFVPNYKVEKFFGNDENDTD